MPTLYFVYIMYVCVGGYMWCSYRQDIFIYAYMVSSYSHGLWPQTYQPNTTHSPGQMRQLSKIHSRVKVAYTILTKKSAAEWQVNWTQRTAYSAGRWSHKERLQAKCICYVVYVASVFCAICCCWNIYYIYNSMSIELSIYSPGHKKIGKGNCAAN